MKNLKDFAVEGLAVIGAVFLFFIAISFFYPAFEAIEASRIFIIVFYICIVFGKYFIYKNKNKN